MPKKWKPWLDVMTWLVQAEQVLNGLLSKPTAQPDIEPAMLNALARRVCVCTRKPLRRRGACSPKPLLRLFVRLRFSARSQRVGWNRRSLATHSTSLGREANQIQGILVAFSSHDARIAPGSRDNTLLKNPKISDSRTALLHSHGSSMRRTTTLRCDSQACGCRYYARNTRRQERLGADICCR
jgi:hypothetical protein